MKNIRRSIVPVFLAMAVVMSGCDQKAPAPSPKADAPQQPHSGHHDGKSIELGGGNAGPFAIRVTREEGPVVAGKDAPIDVIVTGGPKATAVRFWIGVADAKGSIKARAELEDPAVPNQWHAHAEVPDPIPAGSKVWVEVEGDGAAKGAASFDLKK